MGTEDMPIEVLSDPSADLYAFQTWFACVQTELGTETDPALWKDYFDQGLSPIEAVQRHGSE